METGRLKEAGEQRNEGSADEGNAAACHQLLHALGLCTRVIITVTFEQVDDTPNAETGTESDNEGLENANCRSKKCHIQILLKDKECFTQCVSHRAAQTTGLVFQLSFQKF